MKLLVNDIITRVREVEVPNECPDCGTNFAEEPKLRLVNYQAQVDYPVFKYIDEDGSLVDIDYP